MQRAIEEDTSVETQGEAHESTVESLTKAARSLSRIGEYKSMNLAVRVTESKNHGPMLHVTRRVKVHLPLRKVGLGEAFRRCAESLAKTKVPNP